MAVVGKLAPRFDLACTRVRGSPRERTSLADYRDRWLILVFYPRDFSQICPTELSAISARMEEFERRGCDVLGISTDSLESHQRWISLPRSQGGLGSLNFPLASDEDGAVSRAYGVHLEHEHVALRGLFIIDPNGVLQYQGVHNLNVGRRSDEIIRVLAALQTGGMCPEDWCPDCPTLDPTRVLVPGSVMSHYRIEERVGSGSFAAVYRAHDMVLRRTVALKVFRPGSLSAPSAALAEARAAAALGHSNVCIVFAVDESEGVPLIVMEYVAGQPLSSLLEQGALPLREAVRLGRQIALGMAAAHAAGIVHGDLKPANILLTDDGVPKITDFGLARREECRGDEEETYPKGLADMGRIVGTPSYMSPEQIRCEPLTAASDVFSFGAILYEMLTGKRAFTGQSLEEVFSRIRGTDPDRFAAGLAEPFATIVRGALVPEPPARRMTMHAIAKALGLAAGAAYGRAPEPGTAGSF